MLKRNSTLFPIEGKIIPSLKWNISVLESLSKSCLINIIYIAEIDIGQLAIIHLCDIETDIPVDVKKYMRLMVIPMQQKDIDEIVERKIPLRDLYLKHQIHLIEFFEHNPNEIISTWIDCSDKTLNEYLPSPGTVLF